MSDTESCFYEGKCDQCYFCFVLFIFFRVAYISLIRFVMLNDND